MESQSEFRFDSISKDWVLIATGRAKRPEMFKKEQETPRTDLLVASESCPFCDIETQANNEDVFVIPNKFPAVSPKGRMQKQSQGNGFFKKTNGLGFHEVVIFKNHNKSLGEFSSREIKQVIDKYQERYLALSQNKSVKYISIFHNHGQQAGASIAHPHSQIITLPFIEQDLGKELKNSAQYYKKNNQCLFCSLNEQEMIAKERIVFENEEFLAFCPFASKSGFEIVITPKKHLSCFEKITENEKEALADVFQQAFAKLFIGLSNPDYNFYLHTAPCNKKNYDFYHWHFTIMPKTAIWAGFELAAKMEISTIAPETSAAYLKDIKI